MDPLLKQNSDLIRDSQRLLELTEILNLDDYSKLYCDIYATFFPLMVDFKRLQVYINHQRKVCCCYGLDTSFDQSSFRKMQVLACHLTIAALPDAVEAYCLLKSQLFLEQNDFLDDVIANVEKITTTCKSEAKMERLMRVALHIRRIYDIFL